MKFASRAITRRGCLALTDGISYYPEYEKESHVIVEVRYRKNDSTVSKKKKGKA
tara:strand:- start:1415 stop:1576 length:162 start_codon:yes stop_codon:yes gene_type:complete